MPKKLLQIKRAELFELREAYLKAIYWFFSFPQSEIGLNDLSEALSISKTTAKRVVLQLMEEGFLKRDIIGKVWRISCDPSHHYNYTRKIAYNLTLIYESAILKAIHDRIRSPRAIILFGSYRKGDDTEKSDLDIAVEVIGNEDLKIEPLGMLPNLGFRKDILVNMHIFSRNKIDLNLFANVANGIVLEGFLEVRP